MVLWLPGYSCLALKIISIEVFVVDQFMKILTDMIPSEECKRLIGRFVDLHFFAISITCVHV